MSNDEFQTYLAKLSDTFDATEEVGPYSFSHWANEALEHLAPDQFALLLEALPMEPRKHIFLSLHSEIQKPIFLAMQDESRRTLVTQLDLIELGDLLEEFDAESLLELEEELPEQFVNAAFKQLDDAERARYERASKYDADMAGHWVNFDFPTVLSTLKATSALRLLKRAQLQTIESVYVLNKQGILVGELSAGSVLELSNDVKVIDLLDVNELVLNASEDMDNAADKVIASGRMSLPVVEEGGILLGRITLNSAYEHREEIAAQQISVAGGLTEDEDLFAPVWRSSRNRAIWLGINLLTAFLASWCIGLFEETLQTVVALAILMPIVASMGGISGSQTLTVIVRALALGKITDANRKAVLQKELKVGVVNGVAWSIVIGLCVLLWFNNILLGATMAFAILVNIIVAVACGVIIPATLERFKIDPALSGSVVLTTVTDVVGFVVFLGVGTIILT